MSRSDFLGDGWTATVEVRDGVVELTVLLAGVGVPATARLVLPLAHVGESLATLVAVLYGDELLLRGAVEVHLGQHLRRADSASPAPLLVHSKRDRVAVRSSKASGATCAKQVPCTRRHRR